jgi:hypothetical protein
MNNNFKKKLKMPLANCLSCGTRRAGKIGHDHGCLASMSNPTYKYKGEIALLVYNRTQNEYSGTQEILLAVS